MADQFSQGDRVEWNSGGGKSSGTIQQKITESQTVEGNQVAASEDEPRYLVENDSTGKVTAHKPETLSLIDDSSSKNSSQSSDYDVDEREHYIEEFDKVVNMTAKEIEDWLKTDESKSVGQTKGDDDESIGRKSAKRIIEILYKNKSDYTDDDIDHMKRVFSYVHRHSAQRPSGEIEDTAWRYSLMNWGNDPLK
jgi:hypothetical protein